MARTQHAARIGMLMLLAAILLGWMAGRSEILFADGLRYIDQARRLTAGNLSDGLLKAVDHPVYPLAIAGVHRLIGGEGPEDWQSAAQGAAVLAGILLVIPLYLVAVELFGGSVAWLACVLTFLVPLTGHVFADTLSESTFLLFWTWGLWAALRFLKEGVFGWLPPMIGCAVLAYLTRPEGLLLPAAVVGTLALMPLLRSTRLNWPRWWAAVGFLVIGPMLLVGPYVALKGGLGTKPAIARLLGTAPPSSASAVERKEPLDPNATTAEICVKAARAVFRSVRDAVTVPLLPLALIGLAIGRARESQARVWLFVGIIGVASALALMRLHATGGYCTPRHALIPSLLLLAAAAAGLSRLLNSLTIPGSWVGLDEGRYAAGPAVWIGALSALVALNASEIARPINAGFGAYREAGSYLANPEHIPPGDQVVDVTGWSLFYGGHPGYTFYNLPEALHGPGPRWVVVREAHLTGPWIYCDQLRSLVAGREPIQVFPKTRGAKQARVLVFDRTTPPGQTAMGPPPARAR